MNKLTWGASALALVLALSVMGIAADDVKPAADPATAGAGEPAGKAKDVAAGEKQKGKRARAGRLTKPWKMLTSLSEEQKSQIMAIHQEAVEEIKQIEAREREEIMALLSDEQKTELSALMEKEALERKSKRQKRGEPDSTGDDSADTGEVATDPAAKAAE